ncbi:hypothetical protein HNP84_001526 [Thermocatellispora tengchongensis]|uniref:Uncharacterized protein n=1 Tax=Thermocatellispora tengchongensis TaxID=1073253 RepID=A0A840P1K8_9ACTN|nr:hypothetical protein [Thermocatellispora tengchongensis]
MTPGSAGSSSVRRAAASTSARRSGSSGQASIPPISQ